MIAMEKKCECYEVHKVADVDEDSCGCCMNDHQPVPTPTTASWEEDKPIESIKIVPSGRIDYCGRCKKDHGYNCPFDWEYELDKLSETNLTTKEFISNLLKENTTATLREVVEEIEKVKDRGYNHGYSVTKHIEDFIQHKLTSE